MDARGRSVPFSLKILSLLEDFQCNNDCMIPRPDALARVDRAIRIEHLWVVYPGSKEYDLDDAVSVIPLETTQDLMRK